MNLVWSGNGLLIYGPILPVLRVFGGSVWGQCVVAVLGGSVWGQNVGAMCVGVWRQVVGVFQTFSDLFLTSH